MIKVKFHAEWCSDSQILETINKLTINNDYKWKDLCFTLDDDYDFFVIMNKPQHRNFDTSKTIIVQFEPLEIRKCWGEFYKPNPKSYFKVYDTDHYHNFILPSISLSYKQLLNTNFSKKKVMSGIVSSNFWLKGHIDRYNFLGYLDTLPFYEHFGKGDLKFLKTYKGYLPNKEDGLIPYKYHFNAENSYENNYFTEKITDAILCECLCFYSGCPNIEEFIDPDTYIKIDIKNPEEAIEIIKQSIENNEYEKRINSIKKEKERLLNEMNPLNIIYKIIRGELD